MAKVFPLPPSGPLVGFLSTSRGHEYFDPSLVVSLAFYFTYPCSSATMPCSPFEDLSLLRLGGPAKKVAFGWFGYYSIND